MRRRYCASHATLASPWHNSGQQICKTWPPLLNFVCCYPQCHSRDAAHHRHQAAGIPKKGIEHVLDITFQNAPGIVRKLLPGATRAEITDKGDQALRSKARRLGTHPSINILWPPIGLPSGLEALRRRSACRPAMSRSSRSHWPTSQRATAPPPRLHGPKMALRRFFPPCCPRPISMSGAQRPLCYHSIRPRQQ